MKMQTILNDLLAKLGCPPTDDTQLTLRLDDRRGVTIASTSMHAARLSPSTCSIR